MLEHEFTCPYCWESISMLIDLTVSKQSYIEDCEVCCNPLLIKVKINNSQVVDFQATSIEQ